MTTPFESALVRIYSNSGRVIGAGFLVSPRHILTCAHVVASALGIPSTTSEMPSLEISLDFPRVAPGQQLKAQVIFWRPVNPNELLEDIAALELASPAPEASLPVRLVTSEDLWHHPFRVMGFPKHQSNGVWANGVLMAGIANSWVQLESLTQTGYRLEEGFSGAPVWDEALQGVVGMAVAAEKNRPEVQAAFIIPTNRLVEAWSELREPTIPSCPYRGLFAFREEDAQLFFGRETFTKQLVAAVQTQSLVAVIGPSGSGKSSVVFAGLIPRLREEGIWLIGFFRPQSQPIHRLACALVRLLMPELDELQQIGRAAELFADMELGTLTLPQVVVSLLERHPDKRLLLVVDQFEELYRQDTQEQQKFVDALLAAVRAEPCRLTLVLTLRADFYGYVLNYPPFGEALRQHIPQFLRAMTQEEMRLVIERPAQEMQVQLEKGLTERILMDVKQEPGNLPLLEFALTELWTKRSLGQLTHQAYTEVGGVAKALANHAEAVYSKLSKIKQKQAQQIFLQLVCPGEGTQYTRRLASRAEVSNWELVTFLAGAEARLVVTGGYQAIGEETVEIIHEALIQEWERLHNWMEADRDFRTWQDRLRAAIRLWEVKDKDEGALLHGVPLAEAEDWQHKRTDELSWAEQDFIQKSSVLRKKEQKAHKRRRQITIFGLASGLAIVSMLALVNSRLALVNSRKQKVAEVEGLGFSALRNFESGAGEIEALKSALRAGQKLKNLASGNSQCLQDCPTTSPLLALQTIVDNIHQKNQINTYQEGVNSLRFINGEQIATAGENGTVQWWTRDGARLHNLQLYNHSIISLDFSKNENMLATGASDGKVQLWDNSDSHWVDKSLIIPNWTKSMRHECASGQPSAELKNGSCRVNNVRFIQDGNGGNLLATTGDDGKLKLWQLSSGKFLQREAHTGSIKSLNPSPNGKLLATAGEDGKVKLWDLQGNLRQEFNRHLGSVNSVWFCGEQLATAGDDGTVRLWNYSGKQLAVFSAHPDGVESVRYSPACNQLATAGKDGIVGLWNLKTDLKKGDFKVELLANFRDHRGKVVSIRFSTDGQELATAGQDDGTVRLWDVKEKPLIILEVVDHNSEVKSEVKSVRSVRFSPDGKYIATADDDGSVKLWEPDQSNQREPKWKSNLSQQSIKSVRFSPNGTTLVAAGDEGWVWLWNNLNDKEPSKRFPTYQDKIESVNFDRSGHCLATAGEEKSGEKRVYTVKLWNLDGELQKTFHHPNKIESVRFSPDDCQKFVAVGEKGMVWLWNIKNPEKPKKKFKGYQSTVTVYSVGFSSDGKFSTAGDDGTIRRWDLNGKATEFTTSQGSVRNISFSKDGRLLATVGYGGAVRLWNSSGQELAEFRGHKGTVRSVDFSEDGKWLVTAGGDGTARVWPVRNLDKLMHEGCSWLKEYSRNQKTKQTELNEDQKTEQTELDEACR